MMKVYNRKIKCTCGNTINIPVLGELEMQELKEEYDLAEQSAQESYNKLRDWLFGASLWGLFKFWLRRDIK